MAADVFSQKWKSIKQKNKVKQTQNDLLIKHVEQIYTWF